MKRIDRVRRLVIAWSLVFTGATLVASIGGAAAAAGRSETPGRSAPAPQEEAAPHTRMLPVHFEVDKAELRPREEAALKANAIWIKANPSHRIVIAGFADLRGGKEYNLALAQRRAEAVRDYLIAEGVLPGRLEIASYGVTDPRCTRRTEECWARNRRVELLVKGPSPEGA